MESRECRQAKDQFSDLFDGELGPEDKSALRGHLESCSLCREEYASFERTFLAVKNLPAVAVSRSFESRLQGRIRREEAPHRRRGLWSDLSRIPIPIPVAAAALLLLSIFAFNQYALDPGVPGNAGVETLADGGGEDSIPRVGNTRPSFMPNIQTGNVGNVVDLSCGPPRPTRSLQKQDPQRQQSGSRVVGVAIEGPFPHGLVNRTPAGKTAAVSDSAGRLDTLHSR